MIHALRRTNVEKRVNRIEQERATWDLIFDDEQQSSEHVCGLFESLCLNKFKVLKTQGWLSAVYKLIKQHRVLDQNKCSKYLSVSFVVPFQISVFYN